MLARLAVGCIDRLSRFRCCRSSIDHLRLIHNLAPSCGRTETLTHPAEHPVSPAIAGPRWVMLSTDLCCRDDGDTVADAADPKTVAESRTTRGHGFRISADLAAPPASSFLCYDEDKDGEDPDVFPETVVAAHGDSVLFGLERNSGNTIDTYEYFVYRAAGAGAGGGRPPSLSPPLPIHDYSERFAGPEHRLLLETTGLLRRGEDELLVVELGVEDVTGAPLDTAELNVLRLGSSEWDTRSGVPVVHGSGGGWHELIKRWGGRPDRVVPVGDRFLCWVKYDRDFLICDMTDPNLVLRYVPLPVAVEDDCYGAERNMCGAGAEALRFVSIDPRCCCGGPGRGTCPHSSNAFTVTTWTMSLRTDEEMAWAMEGVIDCEELWALPGYEGIPCVPPHSPVVSLDNPDIVCFTVSDAHLSGSSYKQQKIWMLEVDTRKKVLLSVVQCPKDPYDHLLQNLSFS